jgi:cysteine desulfurase/selenocysteine lyase
MPLHTRLKIAASTRASFYIYNTKRDIDALIAGLIRVKEIFKV